MQLPPETREMPNELGFTHAAALHGFASGVHNTRDYVYSVRLLEVEVSIGDPFYTPFALALLADCYRKLDKQELETRSLIRIIQLPRDQQELLNPRFLSACYQKAGDFKNAARILQQMLDLKADDPGTMAGLIEISLFEGDPEAAVVKSLLIKVRPEPGYQVLGRVLGAFAYGLQGQTDRAALDLVAAGQLIGSIGAIPGESWDYRDLYSLVPKMGPNEKAARLLLDALNGKVSIPEFVKQFTNAGFTVIPEGLPGAS